MSTQSLISLTAVLTLVVLVACGQLARAEEGSAAPVDGRIMTEEQRMDGLDDEARSGRPRCIDDDAVAEVIRKTLEETPRDATHWSTRSMARATGYAPSTIHRMWQAFSLQPHRSETFKLSADPYFVDKVRDIVGLYVDPPQHALVLCVDEKFRAALVGKKIDLGSGYAVNHENGTITGDEVGGISKTDWTEKMGLERKILLQKCIHQRLGGQKLPFDCQVQIISGDEVTIIRNKGKGERSASLTG